MLQLASAPIPQTIEEDDMAPPRTEDRLERAMAALAESVSALVLVQAHPPAAPPAPVQSPTQKVTPWVPTMLTAAVLLVGGVRWSTATESELRTTVSSLEKRLLAAEDRIEQQRNYNDNTRMQFASRGWSINPETGEITKIILPQTKSTRR
jgi:hypothetical protein